MHPLHHERFAHLIRLGVAAANPLDAFGAEPSLAALVAAKDNW